MNNQANMLTALLVLLLVGCARTPISIPPAVEVYQHTPYNPISEIPEKVVINKPFEDAWNNLVEKLAVNFFSVEQIDKSSHFISIEAGRDVSRGAGEGWWLQYVSCGSSSRTITHNGITSVFAYETIGDKSYTTVFETDDGYYWDNFKVSVSPRIRMNIYMSPINDNQTEMSVNARYEIARTLWGKQYSRRNSGQYFFKLNIPRRTFSVALTSRKPGQHPARVKPPIMCYSTGKFESAVLKLAQ